MTSPIFTFGFSFGMVSLSTTGRIFRVTSGGRKKIIGRCSGQERSKYALIRGAGDQRRDIVLGREFKQSLTWNANPFAVRHHLNGCTATGAQCRADGRAPAASDDSADDCASDRTSADALGALRAATLACDIIGR